MATTPSKKVTTSKSRDVPPHTMEIESPYYGDPETLLTGSARADYIPTRNRTDFGQAAQLDMDSDFVAGYGGWPDVVEPRDPGEVSVSRRRERD